MKEMFIDKEGVWMTVKDIVKKRVLVYLFVCSTYVLNWDFHHHSYC